MLKKLNLGAGKLDIREGYINLDMTPYEGIDVVWDLNKLPLPFKDEEFEEILCLSILEHIQNYIPLMMELYRILKLGGIIRIRVPHFSYCEAFADPSHVNYYSYMTFFYFTKALKREYSFSKFSEFGGKITFQKRPLLFYNYVLEWLVNLNETTKKIYEKTPLRCFPAANLEVWLKK